MDALNSFFRRMGILFRRNRFVSELDEEMAFHREQIERELQANGTNAEEAPYAAKRRLGNETVFKAESHDAVGFSFESKMLAR